MATIRRLRGKWQAQVRRKGIPPRAKGFETKADAERWARTLEAELDRSGSLQDTRLAERMTVGELLDRYLLEITPHKRSATTEGYRIKALMKRDIAHRTLAMLSSVDVATYRDMRLKSVSTSSVIRELNTLAHAIDVGRKAWGLHIAQNPVRMIRRLPHHVVVTVGLRPVRSISFSIPPAMDVANICVPSSSSPSRPLCVRERCFH